MTFPKTTWKNKLKFYVSKIYRLLLLLLLGFFSLERSRLRSRSLFFFSLDRDLELDRFIFSFDRDLDRRCLRRSSSIPASSGSFRRRDDDGDGDDSSTTNLGFPNLENPMIFFIISSSILKSIFSIWLSFIFFSSLQPSRAAGHLWYLARQGRHLIKANQTESECS